MPIFVEPFIIAHGKWSRTHDAHIIFQNIGQLRQLINACLTKQFSYGRYARIVVDLEYWAAYLVEMLQFSNLFFRVRNHGSEFIDRKSSLVQSNSFLHKQNRSWRSQFDRKRGQE